MSLISCIEYLTKSESPALLPIITNSTYRPPHLGARNGHWSTIVPHYFRRIPNMPAYQRERIETPDGDFFDVDWIKQGSRRLVIGLHGLTDGSASQYILALGNYVHHRGVDFLAMNYRACSGEINRRAKDYHLAFTDDIALLVNRIEASGAYDEIVLVGYSIGGNLSLHYLAEQGTSLPAIVKAAVNYSVPLEISSSHAKLHRGINRLYVLVLLLPLYRRVLKKRRAFPSKINVPTPFLVTSFRQYDRYLTVPLNSFSSVDEYYQQVNVLPVLSDISIPHLLVQAKNDRFLSAACYPTELARTSANFHLEIPTYGGHCGFITKQKQGYWWMEQRVFSFLEELQIFSKTAPQKNVVVTP